MVRSGRRWRNGRSRLVTTAVHLGEAKGVVARGRVAGGIRGAPATRSLKVRAALNGYGA